MKKIQTKEIASFSEMLDNVNPLVLECYEEIYPYLMDVMGVAYEHDLTVPEKVLLTTRLIEAQSVNLFFLIFENNNCNKNSFLRLIKGILEMQSKSILSFLEKNLDENYQ